MTAYDAEDIAIEQRPDVRLLVAAIIVLATGGVLWARLMGDVIFKASILGALAAVAAMIFWEPLIGLCLMVFLVPIENLLSFAGGWIAVTKVIGIITFASFLCKAQMRHGILRFDRQSRWILAFAAWIALSFLWAKHKYSAPFMALTTMQLALLWVLLRATLKTPEDLLAVSIYFIGGTLLAITVSVFLPRWGLAPRLIFSTGDPNHLARDIVVSLLLLLYHAPRSRSWGRLTALATGGCLLLGLVLTQSRSGWVAATVCLPIILIGHKKVMPVAVIGVMAFLAMVLFSMQVLSAHLGVTTTELEERGESMFQMTRIRASRLDIWRAGIILGSHHPIFGVGAGGFVEQIPEGIEAMRTEYLAKRSVGAHNSFVCAFAELGLVGLILLTGILWHCGRFIAQQPPSLEKVVAWALFASAIVEMTFLTAHYHKATWFTLALSQIVLVKEMGEREAVDDVVS